MVILSISKLDNLQVAGTNINIPKYVRYLNKECLSGYLDLGNEDLINFKGFKNYFKKQDLNKLSIRKLPYPFNHPDIVVFQGFYIPEFLRISKELKKMKIPYTIIPRCSLTRESQKIKPLKKTIGNCFGFKKMVMNADFIHFLTKNEYLESKKVFKINKYVIIGNGTELPKKEYEVKDRKIFKIVFIGRYNIYHKGLDILLKTIQLGKEGFKANNIKFIFYGHDSDNGLSFMKKFIEDNSLKDLVQINSAVFNNEKEKVLLDSDLFIHTSRLEGHPTSVIEAISYGIPVLVTPGTNMTEDVKLNNLGYTCEFNANSILSTINEAYKDKMNFDYISKNEIKYAKENFDWNAIIKKILDEYSKILVKEK